MSAIYKNGVQYGGVANITPPDFDADVFAFGSVSANSYADQDVTFNHTFDAAPVVVACLQSSSTGVNVGSISVSVINITTTGFTIRVFNNSANQRTPSINWIAILIN